jgi:ParB-like chromosome segregation protein Spo0J
MTKTTKIERALLISKSLLDPNPWNPNRTNPRQQQAISESLATYSQVLDLIVRPSPDNPGRYQIVDGEHRYDALADDVYVTVLHGLSDGDAKKLTIILNETRGEADKVELAQLLADLSGEFSDEDLLNALPYDPTELEELIKLADADWGQFDDQFNQGDSGTQDAGNSEFTTITARVPVEAMDVIQQAYDLVGSERDFHKSKEIAWGQFLESVAADFLSIPR